MGCTCAVPFRAEENIDQAVNEAINSSFDCWMDQNRHWSGWRIVVVVLLPYQAWRFCLIRVVEDSRVPLVALHYLIGKVCHNLGEIAPGWWVWGAAKRQT
jgi:hypothetical protein